MSFAELVNGFLLPYELNDSEIDDYWRPQAENCNICAVNYTFVGKVTSFSDDMALLVDKLNQENSIGKVLIVGSLEKIMTLVIFFQRSMLKAMN